MDSTIKSFICDIKMCNNNLTIAAFMQYRKHLYDQYDGLVGLFSTLNEEIISLIFNDIYVKICENMHIERIIDSCKKYSIVYEYIIDNSQTIAYTIKRKNR